MSRSQSSTATATATATATISAVDQTPLLSVITTDQSPRSRDRSRTRTRRISRRASLRGAARFLRRAGSRRIMREPSMRVREAAAEQIEERQNDWAYSKPVVILDLIWNTVFVSAAIAMLVLSRDETTTTPLRLWIIGYAVQCVLHMACVCVEYRRRLALRRAIVEDVDSNFIGGIRSNSYSNLSSSGSEEGNYVELAGEQHEDNDNTG